MSISIIRYLQEDAAVASPLELGQENSIEQNHVDIKKSKKPKREELKDINNGCGDENDPKRIKISDSVHQTDGAKKVLTEGKNKSANIWT